MFEESTAYDNKELDILCKNLNPQLAKILGDLLGSPLGDLHDSRHAQDHPLRLP